MRFEYIDQYLGMGFRVGYVNAAQFPPHYHNEYEIVYALRGSASISIRNDAITFGEGECVIINRNTMHTYSTRSLNDTDIVCLNISPSFCQDYAPQFAEYEITQPLLQAGDYPDFLNALRSFLRLYFSEAFSPQCDTRFKLMSLLTEICRRMITDLPNRKNDKARTPGQKLKQERVIEILDYIMKNHARNITLSQIAEHFSLNACYLSHYIHENLGVSFQKYLTRLRLDHAVWLIICNPDMNLMDVCHNVGFSAPKYFRAAFMDCFQYTPAEYRERFLKRRSEAIDASSLKSDEPYVFSFPFIGKYDSLIPFINTHGHGRSGAYILELLNAQRP